MLFVTFDWPIQNIVLLEQNYKYSYNENQHITCL